MISFLLLLLLTNLALSDKVELEYNSLSHLFVCSSDDYINFESKSDLQSLGTIIGFNDADSNSFIIANLKVINGDNTDYSVLPLPSWKVEISAKKGSDSAEVEADCQCVITQSLSQLFCKVNSETVYDSFQLLTTDNNDIKISLSSTGANTGNSLANEFKKYLLVLALFLFI